MFFMLTHPLYLALTILVSGVAVLLVARFVPDFEIKGTGPKKLLTAALVAGIYGLLKAVLQGPLIFFSGALVLLTLGLFIFVINAFLLWLTDRLLKNFHVNSFRALFIGSAILSVADWILQLVLRS